MVKKYNPWLVSIHWLVFLLVFAEAFMGVYLDNFVSAAQKPAWLAAHMLLGLLTLALMVVRIFVRRGTPKPAYASAGNAFFDAIGHATHILLYVFVLLTTVTGLITALQGSLFGAVFGGSGSLPQDFQTVSSFIFHQLSLPLLILLIFLHIGAALYHQFILRDNLLARMSHGR